MATRPAGIPRISARTRSTCSSVTVATVELLAPGQLGADRGRHLGGPGMADHVIAIQVHQMEIGAEPFPQGADQGVADIRGEVRVARTSVVGVAPGSTA